MSDECSRLALKSKVSLYSNDSLQIFHILTFSNNLTQTKADSKDELQNIWKSFGKYISKCLLAGKGVGIQKFGTFNFSPIQVDLAVILNLLSIGHN